MESRTQHRTQQASFNLADIFMQGAMRIVDMQASAARVFLHSQGRRARMFGAPDWTQSLNGPGEQLSQLISAGTEQAMNLIRQTNETITEVNQQFSHLMQQQTEQLAQEIRQGLQEVSRRTERSLEEMRTTTEQAARKVQRATAEQSQNGGGRQRRSGKQRAKR